MSLEVIYQDAALAVVAKPAGLSSEQGLPQALRQLWGEDAYVGIVHRWTPPPPPDGLRPHPCGGRRPDPPDHRFRCLVRRFARCTPGRRPLFYKALPGRGGRRGQCPSGGCRPLAGPAVQGQPHRPGLSGAAPPQGGPGCRAGVPAAARSTGLALVEVTLHTGRTHQIRAQFAARRHPLWGDGRYGSRCKGALALQCMELHFTHPVTGQRMPVPPCRRLPASPWSLLAAGER